MYIIASALLQSIVSAQPPQNIQFDHFSEEHGLPGDHVNCILQDKKGYLWFGTSKGLIKYDGYSFKILEQDPFNKNSLGTSTGRSLCNDIRGNIWVAGEGGVSKYDPQKEYFIPYWFDWYGPEHRSEIEHDSEYLAALPSTTINVVVSDKQGRVWIGTANGLCYLDSPSAKIVNLSSIISPDTLCNLWINCLMIDHNGLLWIGTNNGIDIYDRVHKKIKLFNPPDKNYAPTNKLVVCMLEDHSGNIWIGYSKEGIYRYSPSPGNSRIYQVSIAGRNSLPSNEVKSLFEDSHHTIWVGTNGGGVSAYQPYSDNFKTYLNDPDDKNSLSTNYIKNLFEDRSGALWVATRNGADVCYPTEKNFRFYPYHDKEQAPLWGICKDHNGKVFMTKNGLGVQAFDPATGTFRSYEVITPTQAKSIKYYWGGAYVNYYFGGAFEDSDGNLWVMTGNDEGLHKLDHKSGKFVAIYSKDGNTSVCMTEDLDKRLWIGTNRGLRCYDLKTKKYTTAEEIYPSTPELEFAHSFGQLYCDKDGILWIGGNSGLVILNTRTGKAKSVLQDTENPKSISSNGINCFYDDEKGTIWIGTTWGLDKFDKKTQQFIWYSVKDRLPDNEVFGIVADEKGNLWLSTEKGICKFTPPSSDNARPVCRNYDKSDGLPTDKFGPSIKGNDGTLYFNCNKGIVAFKPNELKDNPYAPPILITDLTVLNKPVAPNDSTSILKLPADETKEIKLSYRQNDFSFTFTALSYIHPEKNQYAYKLENFDKEWTYTDATKDLLIIQILIRENILSE